MIDMHMVLMNERCDSKHLTIVGTRVMQFYMVCRGLCFESGSLVMIQPRAEARGRATSRGFRCLADSYGCYHVSLSIWITDQFHSSPYGFRWIRGLTHMDLIGLKCSDLWCIPLLMTRLTGKKREEKNSTQKHPKALVKNTNQDLGLCTQWAERYLRM